MKLATKKTMQFTARSRVIQPIKCSWRDDIKKHWEDSKRILADERKKSEKHRKDQLSKMFETIKKIAQDEIDFIKSSQDKPVNASQEGKNDINPEETTEVVEGEVFVDMFNSK